MCGILSKGVYKSGVTIVFLGIVEREDDTYVGILFSLTIWTMKDVDWGKEV